MKISGIDGKILFSDDSLIIRKTLEAAVKAEAYLRGADLSGADLSGANLSGADLSGAYLSGAYLSGADLEPVRKDLWTVLSAAPSEVNGLREFLLAGRIDGSTYIGECACLIGTLAKLAGVEYTKLPGLQPDPHRPAERFFMGIKLGDSPATCAVARIALGWIDEWIVAEEASKLV